MTFPDLNYHSLNAMNYYDFQVKQKPIVSHQNQTRQFHSSDFMRQKSCPDILNEVRSNQIVNAEKSKISNIENTKHL